MCANGSSREVCGKSEEPLTTFIGTANIVVNEDDDAFLQRLLLILFHPINAQGIDMSESAPRQQEWKAAKELLSCLQPDLEEILYQGKLDREAMADWCDFMNRATSTVYSRNANLWGFEGYYMTMLDAMCQGDTETLSAIFEYLCTSVVRQNYMATKHSSSINQFVLALNTCRTAAASNPLTAEDRAIHWHNYRTTEKPEGPFHANISFIAIRVDAVCNVIKKVLNLTFKPEEVRRAVEECEWASFGRAKFYRVTDLGYPISMQKLDEETGAMVTIPLPEAELLEGQIKLERCVFFKASKFNEIVSEVENVMRDATDYKTIVIKSANPAFGSYNFYEAVTMRSETGWFGWRAAGSTNFGKYCGMQNHVDNMRHKEELDLVPGIQELSVDAGFGTLDDVFRPSNLLQFYCYTSTPEEASLPPPLRINPYVFRNEEGDYPMPDDDRSKHYHVGLVDDYDKDALTPKKRGRDDTLRSGDSAAQVNHDAPGSTPLSTRGSGVANTPLGSSPRAPRKDTRFTRRIPEDSDDNESDGDDLENDDEDEVRLAAHQTRTVP